jgi:hypothetical protein
MPKDEIIEEIKKASKELAESQKKTEKEITELTESQKKTNEEITKLTEKTDKEIADLGKEVNKVNKMVGKLTNGWGKFVEGLVTPSIPVIFKKLGVDIFSLSQRTKRYKDGKELKIDILCLGKGKDGKDVVIVSEVKSELSSQDINEFLKDLSEFKNFFSEYKDRKVIGVVAGMRCDGGVERYAERAGLYILVPSGEVMKLLNKEDFEPRVW